MFWYEMEVPDGAWGIVEWGMGGAVKIADDQWAPGVWCGAEGAEITLGDVVTIVTWVDLENSLIGIRYKGTIERGTVIKYGRA